ncbi:MAG: LysM peptidoglycan-binding domain-containing protein [Thermoanaerobaculia bacterium]
MRVRCVASVLLLLAAALPVFAAETQPPSQLHTVGDHWTAYPPPDPATFPAGAKVHIIVPGDTLWALAQTYYGNPYLWPQLWEANTYITDAHWIYPGDPLLIQGETVTGEVTTQTTVAEGETTPEVVSESVEAAPIALGIEADIYCWGYLGHPDEPLPNRIFSFEDTETRIMAHVMSQDMGVAEHDIVYIEGGTGTGLVAGETYMVVRADELIRHPETDEVVGRHYDYRGRVRILCASETQATAVIVQSCKEIHLGDRIKPIPELPIPLARPTDLLTSCDPASGKAEGFIVNAKDNKIALGEGNVIEINLGRDDFVEPGDFLTVYRDNAIEGAPRLILGEIGILTAEGRTATARITRMRYAMAVGDRVELK